MTDAQGYVARFNYDGPLVPPEPGNEFDELAVRDFAYNEIEGNARDVFKKLIPVFDEFCEAFRIECEGTDYSPERHELLSWFIDDLQEHQRLFLEQSMDKPKAGAWSSG